MRKRTRPPTHPGDILKFDYLEPLKLTITDLAGKLNVSRKTISTIVNKRAGITPDMALRLSRAFNTSPELWLNMQKNYDLWHAEHDSKEWEKVKPIERTTCNEIQL